MSSATRSANPDKSNRLILMGAIGLALLAAVLVFVSLSNFGGSSSSGSAFGATQDVIVASQDIKAGTKITNDMLSVATLPKTAVIDGAITDKSTLAGLTARFPLAKGDQISPVKLGETSKDRPFTDVVPNGKRAVAVDVVEKTSVGGLIIAGDRVDVIIVGKAKSNDPSDPQDIPAAFMLLQDVEVLSVAQKAQEPVARLDKDGNPIETDTSAGSISTRPDSTDAQPKAKTVTLAVSPEDAVRLALAGQSYSVYLSARGAGDDGKISNPGDIQTIQDVR